MSGDKTAPAESSNIVGFRNPINLPDFDDAGPLDPTTAAEGR